MITIENITYKEYIELGDRSEYDFAIKYAHRFNIAVDEFKTGDCMLWEYGVVKDIQYNISIDELDLKNSLEFLSAITRIRLSILVNEKLDKLCRAVVYMRDSIIDLSEIESSKLSYKQSAIEINSGAERFNGLGIYLQLRELTGGDILKNDLIRAMKYEDCFLELYTRKELSEYQRDLNENMKLSAKTSK